MGTEEKKDAKSLNRFEFRFGKLFRGRTQINSFDNKRVFQKYFLIIF